MVKNKSTRRLIIYTSTSDAIFKSTKDYIQPVLLSMVIGFQFFSNFSEDRKVSIISAFVYFILFFLTSFGAKLSGEFANLFKNNESCLNFTFIMGIIFILIIGIFLYFGISLIPVIFFIIFYILQNIRKPVAVGLMSSRIPASVMASGLSVKSQSKTFLVAVFSPILGFLMDNLGLGLTFLILAVFLTLLYPFIRLRQKKDLEI